jgi:hypothetical protein
MVDTRFGTSVGAWLMHLLWYKLWYTIDAWYGTGLWFGTWLRHIPYDGMLVILVHSLLSPNSWHITP